MGLIQVLWAGWNFTTCNYVIIEPFIEELYREFPQAEIATSIQMSNSFCKRYQVTSLRNKRFWSYGYHTAVSTAFDILRVLFWKALKAGLGIQMVAPEQRFVV